MWSFTSTAIYILVFLVIEAKVEFQILNGYIMGEPYDYGSVMHYGYYYFSLDPKIPTIVKLMPGGPRIGQRRGFSDLDLRKINKFYKCKNYTSKYIHDYVCLFHTFFIMSVFHQFVLS